MYLFSLREPGLSLGPGRIEAFPDDTPLTAQTDRGYALELSSFFHKQ